MILESCYGSGGVRDLDLFVAKAQVSLVPVDEEQANSLLGLGAWVALLKEQSEGVRG